MNLFESEPRFFVSEITYEPGAQFGPRVQRNLQLVYVHEGEMTVDIDDRPHWVPAGAAILLLPGQRESFAFATDETTRHGWCELIRPGITDQQRRELAALPRRHPCSPTFFQLAAFALAARTDGSNTGWLRYQSLAKTLMWQFLDEAGLVTETAMPLPKPVQDACDYVDHHHQQFCDLSLLARAAGVTPQHLTRLFKKHLQLTPIQYLWKTRLETGAELLADSGLSIAEAAYHSGFQTPQHFTRLVRERYGMTPSAYRRQRWETRA